MPSRTRRFVLGLALFATVATLAPTAMAQRAPEIQDRLFLAFIEDAALPERQWWEGQLEFADGDSVDITLFRGIAAFQPYKNLELGGRMGFGDSDTEGPFPDGSGGTDLDLWGKYRFDDSGATSFAAGGILTVPTGDDTAGLGTDAFSVAGFGALRHKLDMVEVTAHAGLRLTGDGQLFGVDLDGETSAFIGGAVLYPVNDHLTVVGEATFQSERFSGAENDSRLLAGLNWKLQRRGMVRAAVSVGLDDGAPDSQAIVSYASEF